MNNWRNRFRRIKSKVVIDALVFSWFDCRTVNFFSCRERWRTILRVHIGMREMREVSGGGKMKGRGMKGIQSITAVERPVIGRYYLVDTVFNSVWHARIPIFGPLHEDAEFLDFPSPHWHIDWRFVSRAFWSMQVARRVEQNERFVYGVVTSMSNGDDVRTSRLRMKREWPEYPPTEQIPWQNKLEKAFATRILPACRTCPHKGMSLVHVMPARGIITCPGHGLRWAEKTGVMVRTPKAHRFVSK